MPRSGCKKIRIAGAGPSGLAASIVLGRKGVPVELHEARPGIASRWKRGFQVIENFTGQEDVLEVLQSGGIGINFFIRPIHRLCLSDSQSHRAEFQSRIPLGYFVKRGDFQGSLDQGLLDQAKDAGVELRFNSRVDGRDPVDIFSGGPHRVDGMGKELAFKTDLPDQVHVVLDPRLFPGGYAYLFVLEGETTLGVAVLHPFKDLDRSFEKAIDFFKREEGLKTVEGEVSHSVANFFIRSPVDDAGTIWIGEAAGFQDYLFGFGIRLAMESGILAAQSILQEVSFKGFWAVHIKPRLETSLWNRYLYELGAGWFPGFFIGWAKASGDLRKFLRFWYREHWFKTLTLGWVKWHWRKRRLWS